MVKLLSFLLGSAFGLAGFKLTKVAHKIYPYFLTDNHLPKESKIRCKKIAIISGSTDGLGKAFANRLCEDGFKIVVLGRSEAKIKALGAELSALQSQRVNFLSSYLVDFSQTQLTSIDLKIQQLSQLIESQLTDKKQGQSQYPNYNRIQVMFVNSCGDAHISKYQDTSLQEIQRLHNVNLNSFHFMTNTMFNLKNSKVLGQIQAQKEFMFVNVSSGVDSQPNRYSSIYSGTKAYLSNLMKTLSLQNKSTQTSKEHTYFLNLTPLYIRTKMIRFIKQSDVVQPEKIVEGAMKLIKRREQGAGCVMHELIKEFPFVTSKIFEQRVQKGLELQNRLKQMEAKRRSRKAQKQQNTQKL